MGEEETIMKEFKIYKDVDFNSPMESQFLGKLKCSSKDVSRWMKPEDGDGIKFLLVQYMPLKMLMKNKRPKEMSN